MERDRDEYIKICKKIDELRQKEKRVELISSLILYLSILILMLFVFSVLEAVFHFNSFARVCICAVLSVLLFLFFIIIIGRKIYSLLFRRNHPSDDSIALRIGNHFPTIKDRLVNGIQVYRQKSERGTSKFLASAALTHIAEDFISLDLSKVVQRKNIFKSLRMLLILIVVVTVSFVLFKQDLISSINRIKYPHMDFSNISILGIEVHPGNRIVRAGEDVEIWIDVNGRVEDGLVLCWSRQNGKEEFRRLEKPFKYRFSSMRKSIDYYVRYKRYKSEKYRIEVVRPPSVVGLRVLIKPPPYAGDGVWKEETNDGEIEALKGSAVKIIVTSNKILRRGAIVFESSKEEEMDVNGRAAEGFFRIEKDDSYFIILEDTLGFKNSDPVSHQIRVRKDFYPLATILYPEGDVELDRSMSVPLRLSGEDDFGILRYYLVFRIKREMFGETFSDTIFFSQREKGVRSRREVYLDFVWGLDTLPLLPEDVVEYRFEVCDNDFVSGPKIGRSKILSIHFPSMWEIFQKVNSEQTDQIETVSAILERAKRIKKKLRGLVERVRGEDRLRWERKQDLESVIKQEKMVFSGVDSLQRRLERMIERLEREDLAAAETIEKYRELRELLSRISSPELKNAMERLQNAIENLDKDLVEKALEKMNISHDDVLRSLDRTISLLKKIQIEQRIDRLVKSIERIIERQEGIRKSARKSSKEAAESQKINIDDTKKFEDEMKELYSRRDNFPEIDFTLLKAAVDTFDSSGLIKKLEVIQKMIEAGRTEESCEMSSLAEGKLSSVSNLLKMMRNEIGREQREKTVAILRRVCYDLLKISEAEESLIFDIKEGEIRPDEAAEMQLSLFSGLTAISDSLHQLSLETFYVTPSIWAIIGSSQQEMMHAIRRLEQMQHLQAVVHQKEAMGLLNKGIIEIQNILKRVKENGSFLGMEEFFKELEDISKRQEGINSATMGLFKNRMMLGDQTSILKLAAEQQAVMKELQRLYDQVSDRSNIAGEMGRVVEEMERVVDDLKKRRVSKETIKREERILSRLLDAQRSLYKKEVGREREARAGINTVREGPERLVRNKQRLRDRLKRDILRMKEEGYSKEYRELIKRYFEAIIREMKR